MNTDPKIGRRGFLEAIATVGAVGVAGARGRAQSPPHRPGAVVARTGVRLPARGEFIVRGAHVITMDPALGDFPRGDVHVGNGAIVAVGPAVNAPGAEIVEAKGTIALPGLVDTHWHMWTTILRSLPGAKEALGYFPMTAALGKVYTPEDQYRAVRLAAAEALFSGITTVHDWCHNVLTPAHADADLRALADTGIRARFSYGTSRGTPSGQPMDLDDLAQLHREWPGRSSEGLLTLGVAARGIGPPPEVYRREWETARTLGIPLSVHADNSPQRHGQVAALFEEHMLGKDVQIVHAVQSTAEDFEKVARAGSSVSLSPFSELRVGFGFPKISELLAAGVLTSVSVDTCALSGSADLFGVMRAMENIANAKAQDEFHLLPRRVLEFATINGARALGIGDRVGSLTPGKRADLILVSTTDINMVPFTDPVHLLVEAAQPWNVDTVIVDGRIVKRGRKLTALDVEQISREATESLAAVRQRSTWGS